MNLIPRLLLMKSNLLLCVGILSSSLWVASADDFFTGQIPVSSQKMYIKDVAVIPDSVAGTPPRMSVMTTDPAGRYFVNDQLGALYLVDFTNGTPATVTNYLDLRSADYEDLELRDSSPEQGFQSFAFHPDFNSAGQPGYGLLYLLLSSNNTSPVPDFNPGAGTVFHTLLVEVKTSNPAATTFSLTAVREVLRLKQPFANHNGGLIAFNPTAQPGDVDYGNLYVAVGDAGSSNDPQENGQNEGNPYGALLRIDPLGNNSGNGKYGLVADNDFASDSDSGTLAEIYSSGLRNPQRFGWDIETGKLFIADIGQNDVEEVNVAVNGGNFGWDDREGSFDNPNDSNNGTDFLGPAFEYDHTNMSADIPTGIGNRAVTIGEVARSTGDPDIDGLAFFGDFPTGMMFVVDVDSDPLDSGQDGISEIVPMTFDGQPVQLLDLINQVRSARGLNNRNRADLRYSVNTPGRIFVLNKGDGVLRELLPPPAVSISKQAGQLTIDFLGTLQESDVLDDSSFQDVTPQPTTPLVIPATGDSRFFRSILD